MASMEVNQLILQAQCVQSLAAEREMSFEWGKLFRLNWGPILQTGKQLNVSEEKRVCLLIVGYQCNWWYWSDSLSMEMTCSVRGEGAVRWWMSRTSASFTPGPLVATTTPVQPRKCRAVSKRGRTTCQANVNDAKAHSRYRFLSHWPGSRGEWEDGLEVLTDNLLPIISWDRQM